MKTSLRSAALALAAALLPTTAFAHTGGGEAASFLHGFAHPLGGLDHILAMVAVGTIAVRLGARGTSHAIWMVPASFVAMMAVGGMLGMEGIQLPLVETGIALSVVVLGLAVALRWRLPVAGASALVGLFAIFHGHAHGAEMPADAAVLRYALGFVLATASLHAAGIALGLAAGRIGRRSQIALQTGGGAMTLAGAALLTGYL